MTWASRRDLSPVPGAGAISSSGGACVDQGGTEDRTKLGFCFYIHMILLMEEILHLLILQVSFGMILQVILNPPPNRGHYITGYQSKQCPTADGSNPAPVDR